MSEPSDPEDNVARLLKHLREGSLAAQLVGAYRASEGAASATRAVLEGRLKQVKQDLAGTEN